MRTNLETVLILGSAPDALSASGWSRAGIGSIVAINNAWNVRSDWDYLIHPEDFAPDRLPAKVRPQQKIITAADYVPVQNGFGGFVYAGGTMAFTAGYWALGALKPDVIAFYGCDMNYGEGPTHFYGHGTADPLRDDITLQSLEAKSARLMLIAASLGCLTVNLSAQPQSRLLFPRQSLAWLCSLSSSAKREALLPLVEYTNGNSAAAAIRYEAELGYLAQTGRYWEQADTFDPQALRQLDDLWLAAATVKTGLAAHTN